ncbi:MAG: hypothetical protein WC834_00075 [Eubacteriales bacterium]
MRIRNVVSNAVTLDSTDKMVKCNCINNAIAVTLLATASGSEVTIKKTDSSANAVTIYPNGSETIDGAASVTLTALNDKKILQPVDGGWTVVDNNDDAGAALVTLTDTQTLTNKTLTTPVISTFYKDAGKTKLMTVPDVASDTLVTLGATQTLTGKTLTAPKINEDVALTSTATELNEAGSKAASASRLYNLGAPVVADVDRIVTVTDMKVGTYTIAAQPDIPRNITVSVTADGTADTMGTITVAGTNYADAVISEVITPVVGSTVAGVKSFKTVTAITGAGWVIDAGGVPAADDITIGVGTELGLSLSLDVATEMVFGILGTTITAHNATVATPATIEGTTIDMSAGTYDGSKAALIFVVD